MHIRAEVISAVTDGEMLTVTLQGDAKRTPKWQARMGRHQFQVRDTKKNCKTYYLGRVVRLKITA